MRRVDGTLGNVDDDPDIAARVAVHEDDGTLERLVVAAGDRHRSRLRVETEAGTDLGVVVENPPLRAGDVLVLDDERAVVVAFETREAVALDLPEPSAGAVATAVELGHRVGNQHWDLAVRDGTAYVPLEADRHIVENVLAASLPDGVDLRYETVDASLWVDSTPDHAHEHGGSHDHTHDGGETG